MQQVLKLEPRQFSALVALGFIQEKQGLDKRALESFLKALALNPHQPEIQSIVEKLRSEVEGRRHLSIGPKSASGFRANPMRSKTRPSCHCERSEAIQNLNDWIASRDRLAMTSALIYFSM